MTLRSSRISAILVYARLSSAGLSAQCPVGGALEDGSEGGGSELTGKSLSVAAGLNFLVTRRLAPNAGFRYNVGMFTRVFRGSRSISSDADLGSSTSRVNVGINWCPMRIEAR